MNLLDAMVGIGRASFWLFMLDCTLTAMTLAGPASTRIPIEVDIQPHRNQPRREDERFDEGFQIALSEQGLAVTSAAHGSGRIDLRLLRGDG